MPISALEIHQTRRFAKRMATMAKAGKHERIVSERARQIIAQLQTNPLHEESECKRTRHGELRLNDCRKYDLSCGYRLIALKRDRRLIFSYIGSHDDCQRWIENNRSYQDHVDSEIIPPFPENNVSPSPLLHSEDHHGKDEEQLMPEIDDSTLRAIFPGLCKSS